MAITVKVRSFSLPIHELDQKEVKKGLRAAVNLVKKDAAKRLRSKGTSKPGEYPAMKTGALRRSLEVRWGRKGAMWCKLQVGNIYNGKKKQENKKFWYAGPLNYGRKDGTLAPRKNAVTDAKDANETKAIELIQDGLLEGIK